MRHRGTARRRPVIVSGIDAAAGTPVMAGGRDSGAMQLVTTSVASFAVAVVGAGLWVTATGSLRLSGVASWAAGQTGETRAVLTLAVVLLLAAVGFKLSLVPFHAWAPTTYPRAGVEVTLLLASVSTVAALGGLTAVVRGAVSVHAAVQPALSVLADATGVPDTTMFSAISRPSTRGRRWVPPAPGSRPSFTSGSAIWAPGSATR